MDTLTELFCFVDDFCQEFIPEWQQRQLQHGLIKRKRTSRMSPSEIMTVYIHFHQSHYRNFKHFYLDYVCRHLDSQFPPLVSYKQFVYLIKSVLVPLCYFVQCLTGQQTGIYFVDSTIIRSCHIKREKQHKVFKGIAKKAKSTIGWFFVSKLHLVINDKGELMAFKLTAANVDDRKPIPDLVKHLSGKLIGDKGYISQPLFDKLQQQGLKLITRIKKNMKNKLMPMIDKILLRKRAIIETV